MKELDKVVFVTGASRGIGEAVVKEFMREGYKNFVLCCNNHGGELPKFFEEVKKQAKKVLCFSFDLADAKKIAECVSTAQTEFGHIDYLINNAGIVLPFDINDSDEHIIENVEKSNKINLIAPILLTKHVASIMLGQKYGGSIVNVASTSGMNSMSMQEAGYCASKAALINFSAGAAEYYQPKVRINCVSPGWVRTEINDYLGADFEESEREKIFVGRFASPEEIAKEIVFLATKATYANGSNRVVNGGGSC